jgi:hypothetical protein
MRVISDDYMLEGYQVLVRDDEVVWMGQLGMPIEDAVFDTMILHPNDYVRILKEIMEKK